MARKTSTPATTYTLSLPARSGALFRAAGHGATVDTRAPEWTGAGTAAGVVPGRYRVEHYRTAAGDDSARIHAADEWTLTSALARKAERAAVAARTEADTLAGALARMTAPAIVTGAIPPVPSAPAPVAAPAVPAALAGLDAATLAALVALAGTMAPVQA